MNTGNEKIGAVLVVGAGIAGIQASLDLAESGFKVYLLDESPAIGGIMAQLDKTFPTNDCAMCILSPKLVGCGRHPNIEIITNAELEGIHGKVGNFIVAVKKRPRYVDEKKCTGCGACMQNCPITKVVQPPEIIPVLLKDSDLKRVAPIVQMRKNQMGSLLPILQDVSKAFNYLPADVLRYVSEELNVPLSTVYQISTFYNAFSLTPKGKHTVKVCMGTACYIKGGKRILEAFERELNIKVGNTTPDLMFGLETISCFGCCGQAPVVVINDDLHGHFRTANVPRLLKHHKEVGHAEVET